MVLLMTDRGDLLLVEEVAQIARVSVETVRYWLKKSKMPSIRPGRRRMIRREHLETFLAKGK
jgi:excisionase family DNA binding protein